MRTWKELMKEYNKNDYTYEVKYDSFWKVYFVEVTDAKGNECELGFKENETVVSLAMITHTSGKTSSRRYDGSFKADNCRLSNAEYEVESLFRYYLRNDLGQGVFEKVNQMKNNL